VGTSSRSSYLIRPSISRLVSTEAHARVQEAPIPGDSVGQEAHRACSERLQLQRLKRWVEDNLELMCSWAPCVGKTSLMASSLVDRGILHLPRVRFFFLDRTEDGILLVRY
jgi:hypothetical protein